MANTGTISVIDAKLYPGVGAHAPVHRPRLDPPETVLAGQCSVSCIVAPAGYGKSTLMVRWNEMLAAADCNTLWLSLDNDDNDCTRFLRHLIAALRNAHSEIGEDAIAQLSEVQRSGSYKPVLESLAADIARIDQRAILFLDDFQFVNDSEVIDIVDWLIHYSPHQIQYVIGSRAEPPLRLGTLRVRGRLHEIGIEDLQFDAQETLDFYVDRLGTTLGSEELEQLLEKTEGWPAGLELAAHALRSEQDRERFIEHFAGTDRGIIDYLGEAVLQNLSKDLREFVYQVAQFDRINAELAAHVTGISNAETLLHNLYSHNLFLIPLDRQGHWYRFHHLVGEFFRNHFRQTDSARCDEVLTKGAYWLWDNDLTEEAVNCAIRAQNWELASQWVEQYAEDAAVRLGDLQLMLRWINDLPDEWIDRYPRIRINYAFAVSFLPQRIEVAPELERLEHIRRKLESSRKPDQESIDSIDSAIEFQRAMSLALDDQAKASRDAAMTWLKKWPDAPHLQRGVMSNVLAASFKGTGEIEAGLKAVDAAKGYLKKAEGYYGLAWTASLEALLLMKSGNYRQALNTCERGLELVRKQLGGHRLHASVYRTMLANLYYEFDQVEAARSEMDQVLHSITEYGLADFQILATLTRARLHLSRAETDAGLMILREGQELGHQRGLLRASISLAAEECIWLCRMQRHSEARSVAARYGFDHLEAADDPLQLGPEQVAKGLVEDKISRVASRLVILERPREVAKLLNTSVQRCNRLGLEHRSVELLILQAMAYQAADMERDAALRTQRAIEIASRHGYRRVFIDDLDGIAPILGHVKLPRSASSESVSLLTQLLKSGQDAETQTQGGSGTREDPGELIEELTTREIHILQHLESGLSNKEIADSIFISEGTLKWHLHNIYGKLDVKNRSGALVKARELKLI